MSKDILIVDDEKDIRALIRGILEDEGYQIREAENSEQAIAAVEEKTPDLMVLDIWLQDSDQDGLEILKTVKADNDILPVLMISGHGTIETAVNAIKFGAYDFIEKPFKSDRLLLMISRALETSALKQENRALKKRGEQQEHQLVGASSSLNSLKAQIEKIAPTNSRVLITGEAGTGKEVVARTIHRLSERKDKVFMGLNCAALHPERLEEELFGAEKDGQSIKGVLELSNGGTLLLDEVADMPLETQGKILRVLQDNKVHPVGSQDIINVDVRILASTNQDLEQAIKEGNFREDLYYRLNVVMLKIPALRKRVDDIMPLSEHFLDEYAKQTGQEAKALSSAAKLTLNTYAWPGNVRQLKNVMEWITIMAPASGEIKNENLPPELTDTKKASNQEGEPKIDYSTQSLREAREAFEKDYLTMQVKRFKGNISQTAEFIGMERSALSRKLKSLDISSGDAQDKGVKRAESPNISKQKRA